MDLELFDIARTPLSRRARRGPGAAVSVCGGVAVLRNQPHAIADTINSSNSAMGEMARVYVPGTALGVHMCQLVNCSALVKVGGEAVSCDRSHRSLGS